MLGSLNEYLVATDSIPTRRPRAVRPGHVAPRRPRMTRWADQIRRSSTTRSIS